jgi:thermostable 8-oxoguanine DNA glycosylase
MVSVVGITVMHLKETTTKAVMGRYYRQLFSIEYGQLLQLGKPLTQDDVTQAHDLLKRHMVPEHNARTAYESLYFCIASQGYSFEKAVEFSKSLHPLSLEQLANPDYMDQHMQRAPPILNPERIPAAAAYVLMHPTGIMGVSTDLINHPKDKRQDLVVDNKLSGLGVKTVSFWYLCLTGGTELMTLDRHVLTQVAGLGVKVKKTHYEGKKRSDKLLPVKPIEEPCLFDANAMRNETIKTATQKKQNPYYEKAYQKGRTIATGPHYGEYVQIEADAFQTLAPFKLLKTESKVDGSLITALLWGWGVRIARGEVPEQAKFDESQIVANFESPYSGRID